MSVSESTSPIVSTSILACLVNLSPREQRYAPLRPLLAVRHPHLLLSSHHSCPCRLHTQYHRHARSPKLPHVRRSELHPISLPSTGIQPHRHPQLHCAISGESPLPRECRAHRSIVQEISTEGYPTDGTRATLLVGGFNISTAIYAQGSNLSGVALRNVQVSILRPARTYLRTYLTSTRSTGIAATRQYIPLQMRIWSSVARTRGRSWSTSSPTTHEDGHVCTCERVLYDPLQSQSCHHTHTPPGDRWSCANLAGRWDVVKPLLTPGSAEGPFTCSNMTVQYNDIGPCGSDSFQQVSEHGCSCRWGAAIAAIASGIGANGRSVGRWGQLELRKECGTAQYHRRRYRRR